MPPGQPKWRRRKEARPAEIVAAAFEVFSEKGFAAARLDLIAARAGVSKGALYLYFETKEELFKAVVRDAVAPNLDGVRALLAAHPGPVSELLRLMFARVALVVTTTPLGGVAKMVIGESRNFPELARIWHEDVVSRAVDLIAELIARGQAQGEFRPGDPRLAALSLMGPLLLGVLWRETFVPVGARPFDLPELARQHLETVLGGLLNEDRRR